MSPLPSGHVPGGLRWIGDGGDLA